MQGAYCMDSIKIGTSTFFYKNSMTKSSISTFALQPVNNECASKAFQKGWRIGLLVMSVI